MQQNDSVIVGRLERVIGESLEDRVTYDKGQRYVIELDLSKLDLIQVPGEVARLSNLQRLDLGGNQLIQLSPELCELTSLQALFLNHNGLTQLLPELGKLGKLETLFLNNNQLTELPSELWQLTNLQMLDLSRNQLTELSPELWQLSRLQSLNLDSNQLSQVPVELGQLASLQVLFLNNNQLSQIPTEVGQLSNLYDLDVSRNRLLQIPAEVGQLTNLRFLSLSFNQLTQLPIELYGLSKLETLFLNNNQLSQIPVEVGQLTSLQNLDLGENQLTRLPVEVGWLSNLQILFLGNNQLSQVPAEVARLTNLRRLFLNNNRLSQIPAELGRLGDLRMFALQDNPLLTPPPEIITQGTQAILAFLQELELQSVKRYEAKLILVGEGGTGKSSLLRAMREEAFVSELNTTHGVEVGTLSLPHPLLHEQFITLNTWDFGGQDIYRATHQFFLTKRSLYLVVWNARTEASQGRLDYWLQTIHVLAPSAPVLLVATHIDEREPGLDEQQYRKVYPQIVDIVHVSNKSGEGVEHLKEVLARYAAILPIMGQPWPRSWINVERELLANPHHHIDAENYIELCNVKGVHADLAQGTLGNYLHDLGRILYFPDDPVLKNVIILKPNWITKAISRVLEDEGIRKTNGILTHRELPSIWARDEEGVSYDPQLYPVFIRLMERFDLSYQIEPVFPEVHATHSLIPQLLPYQAPAKLPSRSLSKGQMRVKMTYRFDFTPAGIMSWMIVRTHRYTRGVHWRNGAVLSYQGHSARIEIFPMRNKLDIEVWGVQPYTFFVILKETLDLILARFEGLRVRREVPCNCHIQRGADDPCREVYRYEEDLIRRYERGIQTIQCRESYQDVSVIELLYGIHVSTTSQVLETLEVGQQEILREMRQFRSRNKIMLQQMQQLYEWNVRNFTRLWNLEMHRLEAECPNTFVLAAGSQTLFHPRNWISESYTLRLLCQNPAAPHSIPHDHGYDLRQAKEWWSTMYPWIKTLVTLLKYGVPLAGAAGAVIDQADFENFDAQVQLLEKIAEDLPDIVESDSLQVEPRNLNEVRVDDAVGSALRVLYHFLNTADPAHHWAGLRRVVTLDGNILWLCPHHAQAYQARVLQLDMSSIS